MLRRQFLRIASVFPLAGPAVVGGQGENQTEKPKRIPISLCLNAYSFNNLLRDKKITLEQLFRFAKDTGFQGVDLTAYYIPGYPDVPSDEVLYKIDGKNRILIKGDIGS